MGSYFESVPVVTRAIIIINLAIHALIFVSSYGLQNFAINAEWVLVQGEYYRIVTAAFTHVSIMHIGMNMMSMYSLGASLEMQFGSLQFLFMSMWSVLAVGVLYVFLSWLGAVATGDQSWMYMSAVGYSGVLFNYAILEAYHTTAVTRSLCGFCDVPAKMYPFVLLVAISLLMPGISFLGHVSGVLFGLLLVYGPATYCLPSDSFLEYLESMALCGCLTKTNAYCRVTGKALVVDGLASGGVLGAFTTLIAAIASVLRFIVDLFFTVLAVIGCPAESIAARVRGMLTFSNPSADTSGAMDGDLESGGAAPPWAQASHVPYAPVATAEAEMVQAVPVGGSGSASGSSASTTEGEEDKPAVKADRSALLAAAESRARGHKF
jgi:rhomboid domain-containing protein 1